MFLNSFIEEEVYVEQPPGFVDPTLLELAFDDTFVKPFQWSSFAQAYSRVRHDQDFPKELLWMCIVIFNSMLKALNTHTHY